MSKKKGGALVALALACGAVMVVAATSSAKSTSSGKSSATPSWCGPKKIKLGFTDGLGAYAYSSSERWAESGVQYVGTSGTTLAAARAQVEETYNYYPPSRR